MPDSAETSSVFSIFVARPKARFVPRPTISNAARVSRAAITASRSSFSFATRKSDISEARKIGIRHAPACHMHVALLDTGRQGRKHLAGIEQVRAVERAFDT